MFSNTEIIVLIVGIKKYGGGEQGKYMNEYLLSLNTNYHFPKEFILIYRKLINISTKDLFRAQ